MTTSADPVAAVRAFTRFYTAQLSVLREGLLDTPYSMAEARIIFELNQRGSADSADLRRALDLDAGYLSRILARFEADLVVLAGYLRKVGPQTLRAFAGRILNTHPAPLPRFGGKGMFGEHVHRAVLDALAEHGLLDVSRVVLDSAHVRAKKGEVRPVRAPWIGVSPVPRCTCCPTGADCLSWSLSHVVTSTTVRD